MKSSLVLLCCVQLIMFDQAYALSPRKTTASHLAIKKRGIVQLNRSQLEASILSDEMINKIQRMPYHDELFKLSVKAFTYNSHITDAYLLALIAVKNRPNNLIWHKKLAQLAFWVEDYSTGFQERFYLVNQTKNPTAMKKLISLAKKLGFEGVLIDTLKMYLAKNHNDLAGHIELAQAQNRQGQPLQAIATLQNIIATNPTEAAYALAGRIYNDLGQWDTELKIWKKINHIYGPSVKSVMSQAVIYYTRGQIKEAVEVLKLGISSAKNTDGEFWQTLADLAWIINDKPTIRLGYSHLTKKRSSLLHLLQVELPLNPMRSLYWSLKGWHDFQVPVFFSNILYLGQKLNTWELISHLLQSLSDKQLKLIEKVELFWQTQARYYEILGYEDLQKKVLLKAISVHPKMYQVTSDLIWLAIANGEELWLKGVMEYVVERDLLNNQYIWVAFAKGLESLGRIYSSLILQNHILERLPVTETLDLIEYAGVLKRAKLYHQAYDMRLTLWQQELLRAELITVFDKSSLQAMAQLAPFFVSGTDQAQLFSALINKDLNLDDINILLGWLVPRSYYALMAYCKANYYHNKLPDWAAINLALMQNDLPTLQTIMEHKERTLPRADRINAAERLENTPLAVDLAFSGLTDRPMANEIFPDYRTDALSLANYVEAGEYYEEFINIRGPKTQLATRFRLTNSLRLKPSVCLWYLKSKNRNQIINVPNDYQTKIKLEQTIHRGNIEYSLGYRKALSSFIPASIDISYELGHRWTAELMLGYNQEVYETSYLLIGGVQDQINLALDNKITERDLLTLETQGLNYYSQDRHFLSSGYNLFGTLQHKFYLTYPDYTLGVFGHFFYFARNGSFGGNVVTLFPNLAPGRIANFADLPIIRREDFSLLIPQTYREAGAFFSFGDSIQDYSHAWRPYLWASLFYNTITRFSNEVRGGINGTVFGRDSLLIYLERGSAHTAANSLVYQFGARYKIYF
jgi:polysaccharide biosynthesis protein PelB